MTNLNLATRKKQVIQGLFRKSILVNPSAINSIATDAELEEFYARILKQNLRVITEETDIEKERREQQNTVSATVAAEHKNSVKIISSPPAALKKRDVQDFVSYFNNRYHSIEKLLRARSELENLLSIRRILAKKEKETVSFIGIISDKQLSKKGHLILTLEDPTGEIKTIASKSNKEVYDLASSLVLDEVVGIVGSNVSDAVFAKNILFPDMPLSKEIKQIDEDVYAIFLSDMHVGSYKFLPEEFNRFLKWLNQEVGDESQKDIASKVRYIFIAGDLVDGVGIYPDQEKELAISDIYAQYEECAKLLSRIPKHISLIICAGNHDAMRISEPQPELPREIAKPLYDLPNITMVTNPSMINIASKEGFSGFDVLMYHGYSFDYFVANVEYIRSKGGYDRADLIMKFLLQRRHLAPTHTATLYMPDKEDQLFIKKVPDFFVTGHIHKTAVANYRNITMICGSCWQAKTAFQEKVGHHPEPARVPIVNLRTRKIKVLKFGA